MRFLESTIVRLVKLQDKVLAELHPTLKEKVLQLMEQMDGKLTPYTGFRNQHDQEVAFDTGASAAHWHDSPHNFNPSLACDLVLDPRHVDVGPAPPDPDYPWLWNDKDPECLKVWADMERRALALGLDRVKVNGKRDRPHVELPGWRDIAKGMSDSSPR